MSWRFGIVLLSLWTSGVCSFHASPRTKSTSLTSSFAEKHQISDVCLSPPRACRSKKCRRAVITACVGDLIALTGPCRDGDNGCGRKTTVGGSCPTAELDDTIAVIVSRLLDNWSEFTRFPSESEKFRAIIASKVLFECSADSPAKAILEKTGTTGAEDTYGKVLSEHLLHEARAFIVKATKSKPRIFQGTRSLYELTSHMQSYQISISRILLLVESNVQDPFIPRARWLVKKLQTCTAEQIFDSANKFGESPCWMNRHDLSILRPTAVGVFKERDLLDEFLKHGKGATLDKLFLNFQMKQVEQMISSLGKWAPSKSLKEQLSQLLDRTKQVQKHASAAVSQESVNSVAHEVASLTAEGQKTISQQLKSFASAEAAEVVEIARTHAAESSSAEDSADSELRKPPPMSELNPGDEDGVMLGDGGVVGFIQEGGTREIVEDPEKSVPKETDPPKKGEAFIRFLKELNEEENRMREENFDYSQALSDLSMGDASGLWKEVEDKAFLARLYSGKVLKVFFGFVGAVLAAAIVAAAVLLLSILTFGAAPAIGFGISVGAFVLTNSSLCFFIGRNSKP